MWRDTSKRELMWLNIKHTIVGVLAWIGLLCLIAFIVCLIIAPWRLVFMFLW